MPGVGRIDVRVFADEEQAAERHQQGAGPNPTNERFDLDAHRPGVAAQRFAQREVDVAGEPGADRRLGHDLAAAGIAPFLRREQGEVAGHPHPG